MRALNLAALVVALNAFASADARAETFRVGPSAAAAYRQLTALPALAPGDVVELEGGADYEGGVIFDSAGSATMPIVVRGLIEGGATRPRIVGGNNTIELRGDHYVLENLDISGGTRRCVFHHAHGITIRDSVVHDCPAQGILGADNDSGSLTLERVEVFGCGEGTQNHQIYMATDEVAHPGSVFRMSHCWVHDGNGGNNVKSRAERNEIYVNWIEGAYYHELELIGPDPSGGVDEDAAREDSDVVGNVFIKRGGNEGFAVVRFGGDGTGQSLGRYRFAFNTVVVAPGSSAAVFRLFSGLESVEMHSNVFAMRGGGGVNLLREVEAEWVRGRLVGGTNNWVPNGSQNVPPEWTDTLMGDDPGLVQLDDLSGLDLRPAGMTSPVVDTGRSPPPELVDAPFPMPLERPASSPLHGPDGTARPGVGVIDRGAYEFGTPPPPPDAGGAPDAARDEDGGTTIPDAGGGVVDAAPPPDGGTGPDAGADAGSATSPGDDGCGCRAERSGAEGGRTLGLLLLFATLRRRRA